MIDDIPWSSVIQPRLTMVTQDIEAIAKLSTDYLIERVERGTSVTDPQPLNRRLHRPAPWVLKL